MQAQKGFENLSMTKSLILILKKEGIKGLFRYFINLNLLQEIFNFISYNFHLIEVVYHLYGDLVFIDRFSSQHLKLR